jgi:hypothetical protein
MEVFHSSKSYPISKGRDRTTLSLKRLTQTQIVFDVFVSCKVFCKQSDINKQGIRMYVILFTFVFVKKKICIRSIKYFFCFLDYEPYRSIIPDRHVLIADQALFTLHCLHSKLYVLEIDS